MKNNTKPVVKNLGFVAVGVCSALAVFAGIEATHNDAPTNTAVANETANVSAPSHSLSNWAMADEDADKNHFDGIASGAIAQQSRAFARVGMVEGAAYDQQVRARIEALGFSPQVPFECSNDEPADHCNDQHPEQKCEEDGAVCRATWLNRSNDRMPLKTIVILTNNNVIEGAWASISMTSQRSDFADSKFERIAVTDLAKAGLVVGRKLQPSSYMVDQGYASNEGSDGVMSAYTFETGDPGSTVHLEYVFETNDSEVITSVEQLLEADIPLLSGS